MDKTSRPIWKCTKCETDGKNNRVTFAQLSGLRRHERKCHKNKRKVKT